MTVLVERELRALKQVDMFGFDLPFLLRQRLHRSERGPVVASCVPAPVLLTLPEELTQLSFVVLLALGNAWRQVNSPLVAAAVVDVVDVGVSQRLSKLLVLRNVEFGVFAGDDVRMVNWGLVGLLGVHYPRLKLEFAVFVVF